MFHLRYSHQTKKNPFAEGIWIFPGGRQRICEANARETAPELCHKTFPHAFGNTINMSVSKGCLLFWSVTLSVTGSNQAYRAISTGQLNALLRLHLRPIGVVVFHGPQGYLVLRGASRLDAFSGYPVRS